MYFFDGIYDAAHNLLRVRVAQGGGGTIDGGLYYRIGICDRLDEGSVRRSVTLDDAEERVVAQLERQLGRITKKSGDLVLLGETCSEGGRADPPWRGIRQ